MKNPLFLLVLSLLYLLLYPTFGQRLIEKTLPVSSGQTVNLNLKFGDSIKVRYWDKSTVSIRINVLINNGKLNDAFLVTTASTDQEVSLKTDFDQELIKQGQPEDCPDHRSSWSTDRNGKHYSVCSKIDYQVFMPRQTPLRIETISGNIDIEGASGAVFAKTISGYVDMSWPKTKGATVAMKTITGEVYSDLDIQFKNKKEKNPMVGYLLEGTLNGGGAKVQLESISNDIYLRKRD